MDLAGHFTLAIVLDEVFIQQPRELRYGFVLLLRCTKLTGMYSDVNFLIGRRPLLQEI
jgi:hypothetical protein